MADSSNEKLKVGLCMLICIAHFSRKASIKNSPFFILSDAKIGGTSDKTTYNTIKNKI